MRWVSRIAGRNDRLQEDLRAVAEVTERLDELGVERWGDIGEGYRRLLLKRKRTTAEEAKSVVEEEISSYCRVLETLKDGWKERWRQTYPHLHVVWYEASNAHGLCQLIRDLRGGARVGHGIHCKTSELRCFVCVRKYLQGGGRSISHEQVPTEIVPRCRTHDGNLKRRATGRLLLAQHAAGDESNEGSDVEISLEPGHFEGADGEPRRKLHRPNHSRIQEALEKALEGAAIYTGSRTDYVTQLTTLVYENGCTMENHLEKACRQAGLRCLSRHKKFWGEYAQNLLLEFRADVQEWSWLECLDFWEQCTPLHKRVKFATISESKEVIKMIFERNGYDLAHELAILAQIIDREVDKANVLHIIGTPNAGKTLVLVSVARSLIAFCNIQNFSDKSNFYMQDGIRQRVVLINEPAIFESRVESFKNLAEGIVFNVDVKWKSAQEMERTPCLISSNGELEKHTATPGFHQGAIAARVHKLRFNQLEELKKFNGQIHPLAWRDLLFENKIY